MSEEIFQNKYRIKTTRLAGHDYCGGAYFITVCTKNREHFLGEIENGIMQLSEIGQYVSENLQNINRHYPYVEIPLFVVMPNHWHAVVFIDNFSRTDVACVLSSRTDVACNVSQLISNDMEYQGDVARNVCTDGNVLNENKNETMVKIAKHQSLLCVAVRGLKSAVTKFARDNDIDFAWLPRFHDHIIRNQEEMNRIADYIENNPAKWEADCYNKENPLVQTLRATSPPSKENEIKETSHAMSVQNRIVKN